MLLCILMAMPIQAFAQAYDTEDLEQDYDPALIDSMVMLDVMSDLEDMWGGSTIDRLQTACQEITKIGNTTGVYVYDLTTDSVMFSYKSDVAYKPASNEKLLTSITALSTLGPDYHFRTPVYYTGRIVTRSNNTRYLQGDIYVCGGFDPILQYSDIKDMAAHIASLGIDSITGRVLADVHQKDVLLRKANSSYERIPTGDAELFISPLSFNHGNSSSEVPGSTAKKGGRVHNPETYFAKALYETLTRNGLRFTQRQAYGRQTMPAEGTTLIWSVDHHITKVLQRMMKKSDNYYAEMMFLQLAHNHTDSCTWNYRSCADEVRTVIQRAGGDVATLSIQDGSGLSHSNRVTPESLVRLLIYAYRQPEVYKTLCESLPIAGVDGTLGSRMKDSPAQNNVRAKTGTIRGVSTLSGYVTSGNGHLLVFSIMNNNVSSAVIGRSFQNKICKLLAR